MAGGIQISKELLYQLVKDDEEFKKKTKKIKPRTPKESQPTQTRPHQKLTQNETATQRGTPSALQPPIFFPTPHLPTSSDPKLESIRTVLKESETVLEKVQKHEQNMVKEVTQRAKELHEKEFNIPQQKPPICQIEKDACVSCYKEHLKDPLKCSTVVGSYRECVGKAKKQVQVPNS